MKAKPQRQARPLGRRPKKGSSRPDTRAIIMAAARRAFSQHGFDRTSMRKIAQTARVNQAMIYYHFHDKVDLYRAVLASSFAELQKVWDRDIFRTDAPAREKLRTYIEALIGFENANEDLRRIFSLDFTVFGENVKWIVDQFFADSYAHLVKIIQDGIRNNELRRIEPSLAIATLIGMIAHSFMFRPLAEYVTGDHLDLSPSKFGAFVTDLYLDGLVMRRNSNVQ